MKDAILAALILSLLLGLPSVLLLRERARRMEWRRVKDARIVGGITTLGTSMTSDMSVEDLLAEVQRLRSRPDCKTCANRGKVDGLSQESHCEHCIHYERWKTDHYEPIG